MLFPSVFLCCCFHFLESQLRKKSCNFNNQNQTYCSQTIPHPDYSVDPLVNLLKTNSFLKVLGVDTFGKLRILIRGRQGEDPRGFDLHQNKEQEEQPNNQFESNVLQFERPKPKGCEYVPKQFTARGSK